MYLDYSAITRKIFLFSLLTLGGVFFLNTTVKADSYWVGTTSTVLYTFTQNTNGQTGRFGSGVTSPNPMIVGATNDKITSAVFGIVANSVDVQESCYVNLDFVSTGNANLGNSSSEIMPLSTDPANSVIFSVSSTGNIKFSTVAQVSLEFTNRPGKTCPSVFSGTRNLGIYMVPVVSSTATYDGHALHNQGRLDNNVPNDYNYVPYMGLFSTSTDPLTPSISYIEFEENVTSTCSFSYWNIRGAVGATDQIDYPEGTMGVVVWGEPGNLVYQSQYLNAVSNGAYSTFISREPNVILEDGTTIQARAYLCNSINPDDCNFRTTDTANANYLAYSDTWQTQIDYGQCEYPETGVYSPGDTNTVAVQTIDLNMCESVEGVITGGFCRVFSFLFAPSEESIERFVLLKNAMESKPPFGYVSIFSEEINSLSTASSTTSTAFSSIEVVEDMQLNSWGELSIFETIRNILVWVLWIVFGFYIFKRFRDFSLHG